jgi:CubicO group peptidase (beta-lactamase class C family)
VIENLQQQIQGAIDEMVESGTERGLQVAVYRDGEQVVDAVAGLADPETGRPVASDTPFYAYATTRPLRNCGRSSGPTAKRARPCGTC